MERFWSRVDTSGGEDACWEWMGRLHKGGYGRFAVDKRHKGGYAHRQAYELSVGPIPEGLFVCHHCDNRKCVNPKHLYAGTHEDNVRDMLERGRQAQPERALGEFQRQEMRRLYDHGGMMLKELSLLFGVCLLTVSRAIGPVRVKGTPKPWTGREHLGEAQRLEMALAKQHSTLTNEEIANLYGVSRRTVNSISTSKSFSRKVPGG